jgi:hypothetical protein
MSHCTLSYSILNASAVESLYGVTCVQTFIYFQNYSGDKLMLKVTVSSTSLNNCPPDWVERSSFCGAHDENRNSGDLDRDNPGCATLCTLLL